MIQIGGVYTAFCQERGILLQKYRDRNGRCIAIVFRSIGVRGRCDSPYMPYNEGSVWHKSRLKSRDFCRQYTAYGPKCMA